MSGSSGDNDSCGYINLDPSDGARGWYWTSKTDKLLFSTDVNKRGAGNGTAGTEADGDQTSDERLKSNIQGINYGLQDVLNLVPIQFDMDNTHQLGFGAQTIKEVIPECVYVGAYCEDIKDNRYAMQYYQIIPVLTKAIQEQQEIINALDARLKLLEDGGEG
jgi:hypothetical protein